MNIETIQNHLREQGYFLNRTYTTFNGEEYHEILCKKINNNECEYLEKVVTPNGSITAYQHLLNQCNNQILDPNQSILSLDEILPIINGDIFEDFERREKTIEKHLRWFDCVETEENALSKNRHVVKTKRPRGYGYFIIYDDSLTEINATLLDDKMKENAVQIKFPKLLQTALKDDLNNEYEERYLQEVEKYHNI